MEITLRYDSTQIIVELHSKELYRYVSEDDLRISSLHEVLKSVLEKLGFSVVSCYEY